MRRAHLFVIAFSIAIAGCSTPPTPTDRVAEVSQAICPTGPVAVQILAVNDFHGNLEPPAGSSGRIGAVAAGGAEYLATHIANLAALNPNTVLVSAGDLIGASPLLSALFHDEP